MTAGNSMAGYPSDVRLVSQEIDVPELLARVTHPEAGAVNLFIGMTRNNNDGKQVRALEYSAFEPMAVDELRRIEAEIRNRWNVIGVAVVHRLGRLHVGESSVVIAISAPHRKDAFEACRYAIDTLKSRIPIWKKEFYDDGESWVKGQTPVS
jgi:molybdopterin synthase catalytic subunit